MVYWPYYWPLLIRIKCSREPFNKADKFPYLTVTECQYYLFHFQEMTQGACLTLKTLEAALSTMRLACAKVSKNVCTCKWMCVVCVCKRMCVCVCVFVYCSRWWICWWWRQRWGIWFPLYKSYYAYFCCLFFIFFHNTTDTTPGSGPDFSQASFDLSSFIGGIILVLVLQAGAFFAMRFLKTKDSSYETMWVIIIY